MKGKGGRKVGIMVVIIIVVLSIGARVGGKVENYAIGERKGLVAKDLKGELKQFPIDPIDYSKPDIDKIEIEYIEILPPSYAEVFIHLIYLPLPIYFEVWLNDTEVTKHCYLDRELTMIYDPPRYVLTIRLTKKLSAHSTHYVLGLLFSDGIKEKILYATFFYSAEKRPNNWPLTIAVLAFVVIFNTICYAMMKNKATLDGITKNPLQAERMSKGEFVVKLFILLVICSAAFIYVSKHKCFFYPQLICGPWCRILEFIEGCIRGAIFAIPLAIVKFVFGLIIIAIRKKLNKDKKGKIGILFLETLFIILISCIGYIGLRCLIIIFLSLSYHLFPKKFMLPLKGTEPVSIMPSLVHTCFIAALTSLILSIICLVIYSLSPFYNKRPYSNLESTSSSSFKRRPRRSLKWLIFTIVFLVLSFIMAQIPHIYQNAIT